VGALGHTHAMVHVAAGDLEVRCLLPCDHVAAVASRWSRSCGKGDDSVRRSFRPARNTLRRVAALCVAYDFVAGAALADPSFIPGNASLHVPLQDFSILLTFSETVQTGTGFITIHAHYPFSSLACGGMPTCIGNQAIIPMRVELMSDSVHTFKIPRSCFKSQSGETLAADLSSYMFRTIVYTPGSSPFANDFQEPMGLPLVSPPSEAWVGRSASFTIFFNEAVQRGLDSVSVLKRDVSGKVSVFDMNTDVVFDPSIPGKVLIQPKKLIAGSEYGLYFGGGAFQDIAGNFAPRSAIALNVPHHWKVSASLPESGSFLLHPFLGSSRLAVKPQTNIVLEFAEPVMPGTGELALCNGWSASNHCLSPATVMTSSMIFLGTMVIVNPAADMLAGTWYNLSIPDNAIKYFSGLTPGSATLGNYTFRVTESSQNITEGPRLVAARIDCDGDGDLVDGDGVSDICDSDGDLVADFVETQTSVDANTAVPLSAKFKLYFTERVKVTVGQVAVFYETDTAIVAEVAPVVGIMESDCVVDIAPNLAAGKAYLMSLGPGVITDAGLQKNPYEGISLSFYTPLRPPVPTPGDGAVNIEKTSTFLLTFAGIPQTGLLDLAPPENLRIILQDTSVDGEPERSIPITDFDQVVFQGSEILVQPRVPLRPGRTYSMTLPRQSIRYMTTEFSFRFSTRAEDTERPSVVLHYPSGVAPVGLSELDAAAPFVLFSKAVSPGMDLPSTIEIMENDVVKHSIDAGDSSCGFDGTPGAACTLVDGNKLSFYPLGRKSGTLGPWPWAKAGRTYTVRIKAGSYLYTGDESIGRKEALVETTFAFDTCSEGLLHIVDYIPGRGSAQVSRSTKITLRFDEDIQRGTVGMVSICVNTDAEVDAEPPCDPGRFADGTPTSIGASEVIFETRAIVLNPRKELAPGQILHVLLPAGLAVAATNLSRPSPALEALDYTFSVACEDSFRPFIAFFTPPTLMLAKLTLFFSEAIQAGAIPAELYDVTTGNAVSQVSSTITGNALSISTVWSSGATYGLRNLSGSILDLAGNTIAGDMEEIEGLSRIEPPDATCIEAAHNGERRLNYLNGTSDIIYRMYDNVLDLPESEANASNLTVPMSIAKVAEYVSAHHASGESSNHSRTIAGFHGTNVASNYSGANEIGLMEGTAIVGIVVISESNRSNASDYVRSISANVVTETNESNSSKALNYVHATSANVVDETIESNNSNAWNYVHILSTYSVAKMSESNRSNASSYVQSTSTSVVTEMSEANGSNASNYVHSASINAVARMDESNSSNASNYVHSTSARVVTETNESRSLNASEYVHSTSASVATGMDESNMSNTSNYVQSSSTNVVTGMDEANSSNASNYVHSTSTNVVTGMDESNSSNASKYVHSTSAHVVIEIHDSSSFNASDYVHSTSANVVTGMDESNMSNTSNYVHSTSANVVTKINESVVNYTASNLTSTIATSTTTVTPCDPSPPVLESILPLGGPCDLTSLSEGAVIIGMFFSEPVWVGGGIMVVDSNDAEVAPEMPPYLIENNGVIVEIPSQVLAVGSTFSITMPSGAIADTAGNWMSAASVSVTCPAAFNGVTVSGVTFTTNADMAAPTVSISPVHLASSMNCNDIFTLEFNDSIQRGTGTVAVLFRSNDERDCADPDYNAQLGCDLLLVELDVSSLPLVASIGPGNVRTSVVVVDPGRQLMPGHSYSLGAPRGAFLDKAGNPSDSLSGFDEYIVTVALQKDVALPVLRAVSFGDGGSPNAAYAGGSIVLFFSESVQLGSTGSAKLVGSDGGSFCTADGSGTCLVDGPTCKSNCGYSAAAGSVAVSSRKFWNITRAQAVLSGIVGLTTGKGYKLVLDAGFFLDLDGNELDPVDGDQLGSGYVMRTVLTETQVKPISSYPSDGATCVPPSTIVRLTFNDVVQMGTGSVEVGAMSLPVSTCHFQVNAVTCKPPADLEPGTEYVVSYSRTAVMGSRGTYAPTLTFRFKTNELDHTPPVLIKSYPQDGEKGVERSAVLVLTFSETIQAGSGHVIVSDCSPGAKSLCHDGVTEFLDDAAFALVDVSNTLLDWSLYLKGSSVYIDHPDLLDGTTYSVKTDSASVFKDRAGVPLGMLSGGFDFTVQLPDTQPPVLYHTEPVGDMSTVVAPNVDIILFFSEAVQKSNTGANVVVTDGTIRNAIPIDNSNSREGKVSVVGNVVIINPFDDMGYGMIVTVTVPPGAFMDLNGLAFAGVAGAQYRFRTQSFIFVERKSNDTSGFPVREGPVMYFTGSSLMLYGGRRGEECLSDLWTSQTGDAWTQVIDPKWNFTARPRAANAPTAIDASGCIWLLGGDCNQDAQQLWKTCDSGRTWLAWPQPLVVHIGSHGTPSLPREWSGHAIAIVGSWQLVVVNAGDADESSNGVWRFMDAEAMHVQRVAAAPLPFGSRRDPSLVSMSDSSLYLVGGNLCNDWTCTNNLVFVDIWISVDVGETWNCQTTNFYPAFTTTFSRGYGQHLSALAMYDDTLFLLAGKRANSTEGSDFVLQSMASEPDNSLLEPYLRTPLLGEFVPRRGMTPTMYFRESVQFGIGAVRLLDYGDNNRPGGFGADADRDVSIEVAISRQAVTITPKEVLTPARVYAVHVPTGALTDLVGNPLHNDVPMYTFMASADGKAPTVVDVMPIGVDVSPWTSVTLTMSEAVIRGSGSLSLFAEETQGVNDYVFLDIAQAIIIEKKVFFQLLAGRHLSNRTYTLTAPAGLVLDMAGNENQIFTSSFTLLDPRRVDTSPPFVSLSSPFSGQSDYPGDSTRLSFYFSESVEIVPGHAITIKFITGHVQDLIIPVADSGVEVSGATLSVSVPRGWLHHGGPYEIEIPPGAMRGLRQAGPEGTGQENDFAGFEEGSFRFTTRVDKASPQLLPANRPFDEQHQDENSFGQTTSASLLFTFNEAVQAATTPGPEAEIRLTPTYSSRTIVVPARSAAVAVHGAKVVVMPPEDLEPGEVYTVTIGNASFSDMSSNFYTGNTQEGYEISTAAKIKFVLRGIGHWSGASSNGARSAIGVAVTAENILYVAGGRHTDRNVDKYFNDVWLLNTGRDTHCAAGLADPGGCTPGTCSEGLNGFPVYGERQVRREVWRSPSLGGVRCYTEDGMPRNVIGQTVASWTERCPCPACPGNITDLLPPYADDEQPASSFGTGEFPSAAGESWAFKCEEGYAASGPFVCVTNTTFSGKFEMPYPTCNHAPCMEPPPVNELLHFAAYNMWKSSDGIDCSMLDSDRVVPTGGVCAVLCEAGWTIGDGSFKCEQGNFTMPTCVKQSCSAQGYTAWPEAVMDCGVDGSVPLGESCTAVCSAGYLLEVQPQDPAASAIGRDSVAMLCATTSMDPESRPQLQYVAGDGQVMCRKNDCGEYMGSTFGASLTYGNHTSLGGTINVTCSTGLKTSGVGLAMCLPAVSTPGSAGVEWKVNVSNMWVAPASLCVTLQCTPPTDPNGDYTPGPGTGMNATWILACHRGYELPSGGRAIAKCTPSETLIEASTCLFVGGCDSSGIDSVAGVGERTGVSGTTCPNWMEEGTTCAVSCNKKGLKSLGQFACHKMVVVGGSSCEDEDAEALTVTKIAGEFEMVAELPDNAVVGGKAFSKTVQNALTESLGVWPSDFSKFVVTPSKRRRRRLLLRSRRLAIITFSVAYELIVRREEELSQLKFDLGRLGMDESMVSRKFRSLLEAKGCEVSTIRVTRQPSPFMGTTIVSADDKGTAATAMESASHDGALNTGMIAGGFVGGMCALVFCALCCFALSRAWNKAEDLSKG